MSIVLLGICLVLLMIYFRLLFITGFNMIYSVELEYFICIYLVVMYMCLNVIYLKKCMYFPYLNM